MANSLNKVTTKSILDATIATADIAADAVTGAKIADDAIDSEHYTDGSIDTAHIADDAVTADKLANAINTDIAAKAVLTGSTNNTITTVTGANAIQGEANLTYDGDILQSVGGGSSADGSRLDLKHGNNNTTDVISSVTFSNTVGEAARIQGETSGANNSGVITFHTDNAGTSAERLRVDSSGNVGIGTASPARSPLHIHRDNADCYVHVTNSTTGTGSGDGFTLQQSGLETLLNNREAGPMILYTSGSERLRVDSSGRVLIGTTTEGEPSVDNLTVGSSGDTGITIRSGTTNNGAITFSDGTSGADEYRGMIDYDHDTDFLRLYTNATEKLRIHSNGAVTKAKSPAFGAHGPNVWQTVTHSSSAVTMLFDTEFYDAGANFNTSTYRFTAPVDGAYQFHLSVYFKMADANDASSYATLRWNKNGSSDNQGYRLLMYGNHGKSDNNHTDMMVFALSANDYVTVTLESEDQDVKYYPGHSVFSGFLIG